MQSEKKFATPFSLSLPGFGKAHLLAAFLTAFYAAIPLAEPPFPQDYSTAVLARDGAVLRVFLNRSEQWCFPDRPELRIPDKLEIAVLQFEDRRFYFHPGIDPFRLLAAGIRNIRAGKVVSGASTISMQVARLMRPKARNTLNKILETGQALKLEWRYSKPEVLRLYLNHAPYGGNIVGFQAAALRYFQKMPEQLTWGEAALLAVLPNAPSMLSPDINPAALKRKRDRLLQKLCRRGYFDQETLHLAQLETLPTGSRAFAWRAAHLAQRLKTDLAPYGGIIQSSIDARLQEQAEALAANYAGILQPQGIGNIATVIAETGSGRIRAYVGSEDFFDRENNGQVDGVKAARSSGSLLKPFLYAAAIDEGILLPNTLLLDIPTYFGSFSPSNASESFDGLVTAHEALTRSLNVPAARVLYTYGVNPFYHLLKNAGLSTLFRQWQDYGLPLILGGAEVTLEEMAMLFRGLANQGRFAPLSMLENAVLPGNTNPALLSPMACWQTLEMLRQVKRPGSEFYWDLYENQWPLAWKTGTSYGQRDAWAIGVSPQWTIAVWAGNFSGEGTPDLAGARSAGPLLFHLFNMLPRDPQNRWFAKPEHTGVLTICHDTGLLASADCPQQEVAEVPATMKTLRRCDYHQRFYTSKDGSELVCSLCWDSEEHTSSSWLLYPPDVVQYLRSRGHIVSDLPAHRAGCPARQERQALTILYPQDRARLWLPRDFGGTLQHLTLRVAHREARRRVFWYLDERYLGESQGTHEKAVQLARGWHVLEVVDEAGQRDSKRFFVDSRR